MPPQMPWNIIQKSSFWKFGSVLKSNREFRKILHEVLLYSQRCPTPFKPAVTGDKGIVMELAGGNQSRPVYQYASSKIYNLNKLIEHINVEWLTKWFSSGLPYLCILKCSKMNQTYLKGLEFSFTHASKQFRVGNHMECFCPRLLLLMNLAEVNVFLMLFVFPLEVSQVILLLILGTPVESLTHFSLI